MFPPDAVQLAKQTLWILMPEVWILLAAIVMMTAGAFVQLPRRAWSAAAAGVLALAFILLLVVRSEVVDLYSAVALNDDFSFYSRLVLILTGLLLLALAHDQVDAGGAAEFFGSLLMINAGTMLVATANELVFLFVGLELVSIPTYLILYLSKRTTVTQEAATKYFFLSIFSSGLVLYGLAFLYGLTGVSNLKALAFLAEHIPTVVQPQLALIAIVFVIAGLGFRVAAVPFHFYAPDVYQGSPIVVTALLAWIPKAVGFLAMVRTLSTVVAAAASNGGLGHRAVMLGWIIAVLTMVLGNTVALLQDNLKRLLAYSSIAHAGYLMIGITVSFANSPEANLPGHTPVFLGSQAVLIYLLSYALMTLGVFSVIIALGSPERPVETVNDLSGLGQTHPSAALAMAICLFSLAGVPPLAGFYGKFALFMSAFNASSGSEANTFWWLGVIAVLNAAIGAFYYLRIVVLMYLRPAPATPLAPCPGWPTRAAVGACAILTLVVGLFPGPVMVATRKAALAASALPDPTVEAVAHAEAR